MTRLTPKDIDRITDRLFVYNEQLKNVTGCGLLEIGCHCYGVEVGFVKQQAKSFGIEIIPVTAGLGIISSFSETVAAILRFLGFQATVSEKNDVAGFALALQSGAKGIFMADDEKFIGLHCETRKIIDNGEATGRVYAAALTLMAQGISGKNALVIGCGPVGCEAAERLLRYGGKVTMLDVDVDKAVRAKSRLIERLKLYGGQAEHLCIGEDLDAAVVGHDYILDATPAGALIPDELLTDSKRIAIPGVPPGISEAGLSKLHNQIVHDKLELGVSAMAVGLLL